MKLNLGEDSNNPEIDASISQNKISLPQGLFGFFSDPSNGTHV